MTIQTTPLTGAQVATQAATVQQHVQAIQAALPHLDPQAIEQMLGTAAKYLPMLTPFIPPPYGGEITAALAFLPAIEGGLELATQLVQGFQSGQAPADMIDAAASKLHDIAAKLQALKPLTVAAT